MLDLVRGVWNKDGAIWDQRLGLQIKKEEVDRRYEELAEAYDWRQSGHLFPVSLWHERRFVMLMLFSLYGLIPCAFMIPVIIAKDILGTSYLEHALNAYFIFIFSVSAHEMLHALVYWHYNKKCNGYFSLKGLSLSFCFLCAGLASRERMLIAMAPVFTLVPLLLLCSLFFPFYYFEFMIVSVYQILASVFETDGQDFIRWCRSKGS